MSRSMLGRAIADGRRRLSRGTASGVADDESGEPADERRRPTLSAHMRRRARARRSASVDELLGHSDPTAAQRRLESSDESSGPDVVEAGLSRMRQRTLQQASEEPDTFLPRPLWRSALDEQLEYDLIRSGRPAHSRRTGEAIDSDPFDPAEVSAWPAEAEPKPLMDWSAWHTCPENQQASESANAVLDEPGARLNPLVVIGDRGTGRTHLMSALAASFLAQAPPGHPVVAIDAARVPESLPDGWMARIGRAHAILIDDADATYANGSDDRLGGVLSHGRDLGAQVVLTMRDASVVDSHPSSALSTLIRGGARVRLDTPAVGSLAAMLRRACLTRGVSIDERMLFVLAEECGDWSSARNGFEQVALAIEADHPPIEAADVRAILDGRWFGSEIDDRRQWDVEELGRRIVSDVLDEVLPRPVEGRVIADQPEASLSDDWQPSGPKPARGDLSIVERPEPSRTPLLDRIHLVPQHDSRLDELVDIAFNRVEEDLHRRRFSLREIEGELHRIRARIPLADPAESIRLTDRLLALEGHLDTIAETPLGVDEPAIEAYKPPDLILQHPFPILEPSPGEHPFDVKKRAPDGITRIKRRYILQPDGGMRPVRTRLVRA